MRIKSFLFTLLAVATLGTNVAHANLIKNGGFEQLTHGSAGLQLATKSRTDQDKRVTVKDWNSYNGNDGGYNFLLNGSTAHKHGYSMRLEGHKDDFFMSPSGGNFFASDSQYHPGVLTQLVQGLTIGTTYALTFEYALAQQYGWTGANLDNYWQVGFGMDPWSKSTWTADNTKKSGSLSIPEKGFSGWQEQTLYFTATSTSELLSFLAKGVAPGGPPFLLLDNVQLNAAVPEPATWALLLGGLGLLAFMARRRRDAQA